MFNKKELKGLNDRLDKIVFCDDCGLAGLKDKFYKVKIVEPFYSCGIFREPIETIKYYCQSHQKDYDTIDTWGLRTKRVVVTDMPPKASKLPYKR